MALRSVFVTVGTTKFDKLIQTVLNQDILNALKRRGCQKLTLQVGRGEFVPPDSNYGLDFTWYRFKDNISSDIQSADLVVSHAGAGSCLEVLSAGKHLLVVINDDLMDNHQTELAQKLGQLGYLNYSNCSHLEQALLTFDEQKLKVYTSGDNSAFATFIDSYMGFHIKS